MRGGDHWWGAGVCWAQGTSASHVYREPDCTKRWLVIVISFILRLIFCSGKDWLNMICTNGLNSLLSISELCSIQNRLVISGCVSKESKFRQLKTSLDVYFWVQNDEKRICILFWKFTKKGSWSLKFTKHEVKLKQMIWNHNVLLKI